VEIAEVFSLSGSDEDSALCKQVREKIYRDFFFDGFSD